MPTANSTAALKLNMIYATPGGGSATIPTMSVNALFQGSSVGFIDIPATTAAGDFDIPFGSIDTGASLAIVRNRTGQDLEITTNGNDTGVAIPDGGVHVVGSATFSGAPLLSITCTTSNTQSGAGQIDYFVFGDAI